jgi:TonB family protein
MRALIAVGLIGIVACRRTAQSDVQGGGVGQGAPPESEAPVALNPDVPIAYPPAQYEQKIEGDVTLRLFVDSTGKLIPESTRVAEGSGSPALDSAALRGAPALRFAPAKRHGVPVATAFLQPVEFRQVGTVRSGNATVAPAPVPTSQLAPATPMPLPPPPARRRRRLVAPDTTTRADSAKTRADTTKARPDTARPDTAKARPDTSASAH